MLTRWFFSQTYQDADLRHIMPVCRAYGYHWHIPRHPDESNGWTLVQMACGQHQLEAAKQDHRVIVLPALFDRSTLPAAVIEAYASWGAAADMDLATLLAKLGETEPLFSAS